MLVAPSSPPPLPPQLQHNSLTMPNVMVHPPEEEHTPAWCLYDAAQPERSQQQIHYRYNAPPYFPADAEEASPEYSPEHNEFPQPTDSVVMQSGSPHGNIHDHQRSFVDLLDNNDGEEPYDSDGEYGPHDDDDDAETLEDPYHQQAQQSSSRTHDLANDSDVVEVVKVSRRHKHLDGQQQDQQPKSIQRVATLKSRASRVFRSLLRSKPNKTVVPEVPPLPASVAASSAQPSTKTTTRRGREYQENANSNNNEPPNSSSLARSNTPTVSRKGSRALTQLFSAPSTKPRGTIPSFEQPEPLPPTQSEPLNPEPTPEPTPIVSPPVADSRPSCSSASNQSLRSAVYHESQPPPRQSCSTHRESSDALDQARLNSASPTPTTASTFSRATRRFSKYNLSRLFTFSGSAAHETISNSNPSPAVDDVSPVASTSKSSHTPVERPTAARLSKEDKDEQGTAESGRATPTTRIRSHPSPSATSSVSTSQTQNTTESGSSSASDSTSGPQTPITSEPDLRFTKHAHAPSSQASSPPSIYSVDSFGSRELEPSSPMHNFDSLFEADKSLNLGLGIDFGKDIDSNNDNDRVGKAKASGSATLGSKKRVSSAGAFGSFITGKRGNRVFSAPGLMKGHSKQSIDKMKEEEKEEELEMRLDSFHFDDLSFDADRFRAEL